MSPRKVHPKMAPFLAAAKRKFYIGAGARTSGRNICISKYIKAATEKKTFAKVAWGGGGGLGGVLSPPLKPGNPCQSHPPQKTPNHSHERERPAFFSIYFALALLFLFGFVFVFVLGRGFS